MTHKDMKRIDNVHISMTHTNRTHLKGEQTKKQSKFLVYRCCGINQYQHQHQHYHHYHLPCSHFVAKFSQIQISLGSINFCHISVKFLSNSTIFDIFQQSRRWGFQRFLRLSKNWPFIDFLFVHPLYMPHMDMTHVRYMHVRHK